MSESIVQFVKLFGTPIGTKGYPVGGKDADGLFQPLSVTTSGLVVAQNSTIIQAAARGQDANLAFVQRHAEMVTPNTSENRLSLGGYTTQTTEAQRSFRSTNTNDTSTGTGARKIQLLYMNSSRSTLLSEIITLSGTSWVNTVATDIRYIHDLNVVSVGSNGAPLGDVEVNTAVAGGGTVFTKIVVGNNEWMTASMHLPLDRRQYLTSAIVSSESGTLLRLTNQVDFTSIGGGIITQSRKEIFTSAGAAFAYDGDIIITDPGGDFDAFVTGPTNKRWFLTISGFEELLT